MRSRTDRPHSPGFAEAGPTAGHIVSAIHRLDRSSGLPLLRTRRRSPPGTTRRLAWGASLGALLLLTGCFYSFTGGGLPRHIRTVAVVQFQNETSQPLVESELETRLQQELPRNLGVRLAGESAADAVVRGRITGYEETAASVRPAGPGDRIPVVQRQVRISYDAEIYDMREDRPLWQGRSQSVIANFQPDTETVEVGRTRAIQEMVRKVIEGAQSQW